MKWTREQLQSILYQGKYATIEQVMRCLDDPLNDDLFQIENFSCLWAIIGVAGVKGASVNARVKIWKALKNSGVVEAFDKGTLADFNRQLIGECSCNVLKAWKAMDNFQASIKFRKTVLDKLVKTNAFLASEVSPYCSDYKKLIEQLDKSELSDKLKAYLERFSGLGAACGMTEDAVVAVYEKTDMLRKLCDVAAYTHRKLSENEKNYLFHYLFDAVNDGFSPSSIGLNDAVLAKLMADDALDGLSELEAAPLLARNAEIEDFAEKYESELGFYEETAAKFIRHEPGKIKPLIEKCLKSIQKGKDPRGVVFALALVDLNQIKSAVQILLELAKKGKATEISGFLHRLLPKVKGTEHLILDIICMNLQNIADDDDFLKEYAVRRAMTAARLFVDASCDTQAVALLKYLILGNWFDGVPEMIPLFIGLANTIISRRDELTNELCFLAQQLKLNIYDTDDGVLIGTEDDNPLMMARKQLEKTVLEKPLPDFSKVVSEMKSVEAKNSKMLQDLDDILAARSNRQADTLLIDEEDLLNASQNEPKQNQIAADEGDMYYPTYSDEVPLNLSETPVETDVSCHYNSENSENVFPQKPLDDSDNEPTSMTSLKDDGYALDEQANATQIAEPEQPLLDKSMALPDFKKWDEGDTHSDIQNSRKININNILNIKSDEVDKHFEQIKNIASSAFKKAELHAKQIKERVENAELSSSASVGKIKNFAKKIKLFKKK